MKIITYAHRLEIGGTQINAIELSAALRDLHGCEVILFATPGPLLRMAQERNLRFVAAPDGYVHPSPARMAALRELVRAERPDVIHAWDWWQCLDAYYAAYLPWRIPLLATDMMPTLARVLPKQVSTTFATPEMIDIARAAGRRHVDLLLPPIDVQANSPNAVHAVDARLFRMQYGLDDSHLNIVTVSRLAEWMKSESLIRTIESVRVLGQTAAVRLVIVGDGQARGKLEQLANQVNSELGRRAVVFTGALLDPRPAYATADIVVGMGGSALRGMAFAKPVIVVGEAGFSAPFNAETAPQFLHTGMYGIGDGAAGNKLLTQQLADMVANRDWLATLGLFGRRFVESHFALEVVSQRLHEQLRRAIAEGVPRTRSLLDAVRTSAVYVRERRFLCPSRDKKPLDAVTDAATATSKG